jgi:hypothetical protein
MVLRQPCSVGDGPHGSTSAGQMKQADRNGMLAPRDGADMPKNHNCL